MTKPTETPTREKITPEVIDVVKKTSDRWGVPKDPIEEKDRLRETLRLTETIIGAMYKSFTKISKKYGGQRVLKKDVVKEQTVKGCINLVFKRAQEKPQK